MPSAHPKKSRVLRLAISSSLSIPNSKRHEATRVLTPHSPYGSVEPLRRESGRGATASPLSSSGWPARADEGASANAGKRL